MAKAFSAGRRGITGYLEPAERDLLRKLFADIITMLEPDTPAHEDPLAALIGLDMDVQRPGRSGPAAPAAGCREGRRRRRP